MILLQVENKGEGNKWVLGKYRQSLQRSPRPRLAFLGQTQKGRQREEEEAIIKGKSEESVIARGLNRKKDVRRE